MTEPEALEALGSDRRTFLKRLVVGTAFAAPIISSFTMSGVEAVFGDVAGATMLMSNSNSAGPLYTNLMAQGVVNPAGLNLTGTAAGIKATIVVPAGALPSGTFMILWRAPASNLQPYVPAGATAFDGVAAVWIGPIATTPMTLTVTDNNVADGDQVFLIDGTTATEYEPGLVTDRTWVALFTDDPNFFAVRPAEAPPTPPLEPTVDPAAALSIEPRFTG
jgi:hypothetical protein